MDFLTDIFAYEFNQRALLAAVMIGFMNGYVGGYVVLRRGALFAGSLSHTLFPGVALGALVAGLNPYSALIGAFVMAMVVGLGSQGIAANSRIDRDASMAILFTAACAAGLLILQRVAANVRIEEYLFGNILTVPTSDLLLMLILDAVIIGLVVALYKEFLALSFDEEFGKVLGVPVEALYLLLLCMIALTVVILLRVVGMILVIALLTIPAALAKQFTYDLRKMMLLAILFGAVFTFGGLCLSYALDLASGATIILLSGATLLASLGFSRLRSRWSRMQENEVI